MAIKQCFLFMRLRTRDIERADTLPPPTLLGAQNGEDSAPVWSPASERVSEKSHRKARFDLRDIKEVSIDRVSRDKVIGEDRGGPVSR